MTRAFVIKIIKEAKTGKRILLGSDNVRFQFAVINQEFLASLKEKIKRLYLSSYSPELNLIESFLKKTRRSVTHNKYFESLAEQRGCLERFFNKFKKTINKLTSLSAKYYAVNYNNTMC